MKPAATTTGTTIRDYGGERPEFLANDWDEFSALVEAVPAAHRRRRIHVGHGTWLEPAERKFVTPERIAATRLVGSGPIARYSRSRPTRVPGVESRRQASFQILLSAVRRRPVAAMRSSYQDSPGGTGAMLLGGVTESDADAMNGRDP
jgi:hypothetical protein